ncbi:MAG: interleukin-like EMT inducer domain-containing protein [bacterium]
MLSLVTSLFVFLAAAAFAICAAAEDATTLTIRTLDGLILLRDSEERLLNLHELLGRERGPLDTARTMGALRGTEYAPSGMDVYYSARPGSQWRKPTVERMPLEDAVKKGLIPNVAGRDLMDAYLLLRANGMKMGLFGEPPPESALVGAAFVSLHSSMIGARRSSIVVNGESFVTAKSGYLLVVLSPDGEKIIADEGFGTYGSFEDADAMERFLRAQPQDSILLGVDYMGPGVFISGGAMDAMRQYGLHAPMDPQIPLSHAFVGRKGLPPGKGVEAYARAQDSQISVFPGNIYVDEEGLKERAESLSRVSEIILSGTDSESEVVILNLNVAGGE